VPTQHIHSFPTRRSSDLYHHSEEWSDQRPSRTDHRLLIAHRYIAPGEHVKQLAVSQQVARVIALLPAWLDDNFVCHCHLLRPDRSEEHTSELQSRFDLVC